MDEYDSFLGKIIGKQKRMHTNDVIYSLVLVLFLAKL